VPSPLPRDDPFPFRPFPPAEQPPFERGGDLRRDLLSGRALPQEGFGPAGVPRTHRAQPSVQGVGRLGERDRRRRFDGEECFSRTCFAFYRNLVRKIIEPEVRLVFGDLSDPFPAEGGKITEKLHEPRGLGDQIGVSRPRSGTGHARILQLNRWNRVMRAPLTRRSGRDPASGEV